MTTRIALGVTLRAPLADTLSFVRYHRSIGIDPVIVTLDDPNDPARDALAAINGVVVVPSDDAHRAKLGITPDAPIETRLHRNAQNALELARGAGAEWCVIVDGDELIHAPGGLAATLDAIPQDQPVGRFAVREAVPDGIDHRDPFREVHTFRAMGPASRLRLAKRLAPRAFFHGEYLRGHVMGKSAVRTSADVVEFGSHRPVLASGRPKARPLESAFVLHYDCCSLAAFQSKWSRRVDGSARADELRPGRAQQLKAYAAAASDPSKVEELFRRLYLLGPWERFVLSRLGLLETINVDPSRFEAVGA